MKSSLSETYKHEEIRHEGGSLFVMRDSMWPLKKIL